MCKWVDKNTNERCDQPSFDISKNGSLPDNGEFGDLCLNHLALKKINKLRYDKYKLIKDKEENEDNLEEPICSFNQTDTCKFDLNEIDFSRQDTQQGESRRINRKNMMKQIKEQKYLSKNIFKSNKKSRNNLDIDEYQNECSNQEEDDDDDDEQEIKNDLIYKDKIDLDNDLDLLDSSDSLDQTIFNIIKSANPKFFKNNNENGPSSHDGHSSKEINENKSSSIKFDYDKALRYVSLHLLKLRINIIFG